MADIKLTPDDLRGTADQLNGDLGAAQQLYTNVNQHITKCLETWTGNQREKYQGSYEEIKPILQDKLPALLSELSEALKTIADNFDRADNA